MERPRNSSREPTAPLDPALAKLLNPGIQKGTATTKWKNGKTSTFSITAKEGTGSNFNVATLTGKVTKGLFVGHTVTGAVKFTPNSGACTSKPFSSLTFTQTKPLVLH